MRNVLAAFLATTMVAPLLLERSAVAPEEPKPSARSAAAAEPDARAAPGTPQGATAVPAAAAKDSAAPVPNLEGRLRSVCIREDGIWASCPKGIFRALEAERKWRPVPVDIRIPLNGEFAQQPRDPAKLYYFTPRYVWEKPSANEKTLGLYRYDPNATKWELLSSEYAFKDVLRPRGRHMLCDRGVFRTLPGDHGLL